MDSIPPGCSAHEILQARILEWIAMPSSGDLPHPGIVPTSFKSPALTGGFFTTSPTWESVDLLVCFLNVYWAPTLCHHIIELKSQTFSYFISNGGFMWEEQRTAIPDKQATAKSTGKSNKGKELYLTEIKKKTRRGCFEPKYTGKKWELWWWWFLIGWVAGVVDFFFFFFFGHRACGILFP